MRFLQRALLWLTTLLVPVILILMSVRLLMTPIYIQVEYRMPWFPEDTYGFDFNERLYWANISRNYLINNQGIEYLGDQQLDENTPLYNQRELRHMLDVKSVLSVSMNLLLVALIFELGFGIWSFRFSNRDEYLAALARGGWLSSGLVIAVLVYLALNFRSLFTNFHRIFFEGDTWLFQFSDTLIRLFPIEFWRDAFIWIAVITIATGIGLGYFVTKLNK
jgi:integral membrane protein (TIGR01906 family)